MFLYTPYPRRSHRSRAWQVALVAILFFFILLAAATGPAAGITSAAPAACPGAPDNPDLPDVLERDDFCVYYRQGPTTVYEPGGTTTLADATAFADWVDAYWQLYTDDLGFLPPSAAGGKLRLYLSGGALCTAQAFFLEAILPQDAKPILITSGCQSPYPEQMQIAVGHELFHRVQWAYNLDLDQGWLYEGTARAMEDHAYTNIDNWANAHNASFSFHQEVNNYLAAPGEDITSHPMRYRSALWWKYFAEQYGSGAAEPAVGIDAFIALWEAAEDADGIAAVNSALAGLGAGTTFNQAFRRFVVANWTKELSGLPDASYSYIDEAQAHSLGLDQLHYGPLTPIDGGALAAGDTVTWSDGVNPADDQPYQYVSRYGARYYQATPGPNCQIISAAFDRLDNGPAFYHLVTQNGDTLVSHVEGSGGDWAQSFLAGDLTRLVAIAGSLGNSSEVAVTIHCAQPVLEIILPNDQAVAYAGPADDPGRFLAQVLVTDGAAGGPVVAGLAAADFAVEVNGQPAAIVAGGYIQEQYWLDIQAPEQAADGTYDLQITLATGGGPAANDTATSSVAYGPEATDHVLVLDRSGSMFANGKMAAAQAAAAFYIDVTGGGDGLSVVPFNQDVSPAPYSLQAVDATVRDEAKGFVDNLVPLGRTSIGDGLQEAVNQRAASPTANERCSFVLLSDGMENEPASWADVAAGVTNSGCPVTTIAFGPESDELLMQAIATATGGPFFYNDVYVSGLQAATADTPAGMALALGSSYEYAQAQSEGRQRLLAGQGTLVAPLVEQRHAVLVEAKMSRLLIALDWNDWDANLQLRLQRPDGAFVEPATTPYTFYDGRHGHLGWRIEDPLPGRWEIIVSYLPPTSPQMTVPYQVLASGVSPLSLQLILPNRTGALPLTGEAVPIYAILAGDEPVTGARVEAHVIAPDGTETRLPLLDDGDHGDGAAGDGIYGNNYTRGTETAAVVPEGEDGTVPVPNDEGSYRVIVHAAGPDFQREAPGSFTMEAGPDANGNGLPDPFETRYGLDDPGGDPDFDGLLTGREYDAGTNPLDPDSDGGGESDGSEVQGGRDPLDPSDDIIKAPAYIQASPGNGAVFVAYDHLPTYRSLRLYRATGPDGPWVLREADLPADGIYRDEAVNGTTYTYLVLATGPLGAESAALRSEPVTPSADPQPPEAQVLINDGAPATASRQVRLSLVPYAEGDAFDDITQIQISNDPSLAGANWQPYPGQDMAWTLAEASAGEVVHVYVRFRDAAGNTSVGVTVASIIYQQSVHYLPLVVR